MRTGAAVGACTLILVIAGASGPAAQDTARPGPRDTRWTPWLGCWTPTDMAQRTQDVQVCVVPAAAGDGIRMMTFAADQIVLDESIVADGVKHPVGEDEDRCGGSRQSRWATSGARLFTTTELTCSVQPARQGSGISTLVAPNQWLDVNVAGATGREVVRIRRYFRSSDPPPTSIAALLDAVAPPGPIPSGTPTIDDVVEAHRAVSSRAVEAWLVETEPRMAVDRRALTKMAGAGLSEPLIDLLVALSYPEHFDVRRSSSGSSGGSPIFFADDASARWPWASWVGPWGLAFDPYAYYYSPFMVGYGLGMYTFYDPYGGGGYVTIPDGGDVTPPVALPHGQVVNGQGYTRVQPHETAAARSGSQVSSAGADSAGASSAGASSGGGSSSAGASPAGYSSGGAGSTGVTAVPR